MIDWQRSRRVLWQKQRRTEIAAAAEPGGVALPPTGAIEQHGPHLPIDTDSWSSFTVSVLAAEQVQEFPALVLPPIWWGRSPHRMILPGSLSLRAETPAAVTYDVLRSVAQHGLRRAVIVNGHGGLIQAAVVKVPGDDLQVAALTYWNLVPEVLCELSERDGGNIGHAGEMEPSIPLYLQPDCVDQGAVSPNRCLDLPLRAERRGAAAAGYQPANPKVESPHQGLFVVPL